MATPSRLRKRRARSGACLGYCETLGCDRRCGADRSSLLHPGARRGAVVRIVILNFGKHHPRADYKNLLWIRLETNFPRSKRLHGLPIATRYVYLSLLCLGGKENRLIDVEGFDHKAAVIDGGDAEWIADEIKVSLDELLAALPHLVAKGLISAELDPKPNVARTADVREPYISRTDGVRDPNEPVRDPFATEHNVTRHNEQNETEHLSSGVSKRKGEGRSSADPQSESSAPTPVVIPAPAPPAKRPRRKRAVPIDLSESDLAVGREWLTYALEEMPWKATDGSWTAERFGGALAKLKTATGLNDLGLRELLAFVRGDTGDTFWRPNACSPFGLLKKSENGNRKIDNILVRMRTKSDRQADGLLAWAQEKERSL